MSGFDDLQRQLKDGVVREAERSGGAAARRRRWRRRFGGVPLLGLVALFGLGGVAVAAVLLQRGEPVPRGDGFSGRVVHPMTLPLRVEDPAGGLPWGIGIFRQGNRPVICVRVARVQGDELGVIGQNGSFGNDGRFHPLSPKATQSGMCGGASTEDHISMMGGSPSLVPASGYSGDPAATTGGIAVSGCSNPGEKPERHQRVCRPEELRLLKSGFAGQDASLVVYRNKKLRFEQTPIRETSGAYLFVYRPQDAAGGGPMKLTTTYRDGAVCDEFLGPTPGHKFVPPKPECQRR